MNQMDHASSVGSRIVASASALTKDFFSVASASDASTALRMESDGKSLTASTSGHNWSSASSSRIHPACSSSGHEDPNDRDSSREKSFRNRSSDPTSHGQRAFDSFMADQGVTSPDCINWEEPSWCAGVTQTPSAKQAHEPSGFASANANRSHEIFDGAAVVSLLSSPDFTVQSLQDDELDEELELEGERYETSYKKRAVDKDLSHLFIPHPRHLLPNFSQESLAHPRSVSDDSMLDSTDSSTRICSHPPSAPAFMRPWIDMLSSYHEEVWGDRIFMENKVHPETPAIDNAARGHRRQSSATSRLEMIRGHLEFLP